MSLVMPLAGLGRRFREAGRDVPKPLLPLDGKTFVEWSLLSAARALAPSRISFVTRHEHAAAGLHALLERISPGCLLVSSEGPPTGAAIDAMRAVPFLPEGEPMAVNDCDHAFVLRRPLAQALPSGGDDGVVLVGFPSRNPAHAFAVFDGPGLVARVEEKRVAGPVAVGGCYLFSSARLFARAAAAARVGIDPPGELYVSAVVNAAIRLGAACAVEQALDYAPFGTPSELAALPAGRVRDMLAHGAEP